MRETVLTVFSAVLGAIIGSFLNACIHRLPRNLSLDQPRRSFCPSCGKTIPWYENLPIISWLALRGRCSGCHARISPRYIFVEILTAGLFLAAWLTFGLPLAPAYWLFLALLVTATFIDIEHFIIPDVITIGGTAAGVILSVILPGLMQTDSRIHAFLASLGAAALGYGILWLIVEGGKLAFGRKRHVFKEELPFRWKRDGDTATLTVGEDSLLWHEIDFRERDQLVIESTGATIDGRVLEGSPVLRFRYHVLLDEGTEKPLDQIDEICGKLTAITIPREAMGFGDVKFIAAIGAFLGWQAVLFTICAASIIGCVAAVAGIFLARDRSGARVPFGPFLALGAALWVFFGPAIWDWYFNVLARPGHDLAF
jgi:leader peptidase (prepilin peptidase)/N-methyltransferase